MEVAVENLFVVVLEQIRALVEEADCFEESTVAELAGYSVVGTVVEVAGLVAVMAGYIEVVETDIGVEATVEALLSVAAVVTQL